METVGARELKDRLAYYLQTVRSGKTVVVTIRGEPVARLVPVVRADERGLPPEVEERMWDLAARGVLEWSGASYRLPEPVAENRGAGLLSDLVVEDRE
ncbi:MAG: type II toxin-antitoxin system prevent-host-death family antitoxin [Anaerolineae bacterium]|nr:type II toxin-antitoxin system prevent-host-death family antitoxin [Anaerolineae bacterium]